MTTTTPLCIFCAVEMVLKTIFGKQIYECPVCKRRVPAEIISETPDSENITD